MEPRLQLQLSARHARGEGELRAVACSRIDQSVAQLKAQELTISTAVINAGLNVENAYKLYQASVKSREAAETQRRTPAQVRFDNGMLTNFEVVTNQQTADRRAAQRTGRAHQLHERHGRVRARPEGRRLVVLVRRTFFRSRGIRDTVVAGVPGTHGLDAKDSPHPRRRHPRRRRGVVLPLRAGLTPPRRPAARRAPARGRGGARRAAAPAGRTPMTVDTGRRSRATKWWTTSPSSATWSARPRSMWCRAWPAASISIPVKLGDRVSRRGQVVAKIEDREIREQINQAQATLEVNKANVTQRENEVQVQQNALERTKTTASRRGLTARQMLEDAEARYNAAVSQLNVAKAQQIADAVAHRRAEDHAVQHDRASPPSTAS